MITTQINKGEVRRRCHVTIPYDIDRTIARYQDEFEAEYGSRPTVSLTLAKLVKQSDTYKELKHQ